MASRAIGLLLLAASVFCSCKPLHAQTAPTVLILDQGGPGLLAFADMTMNLRSVLNREVRAPVTLYAESLDLSRFGGPSYQSLQEEFLRRKYADVKISLIVALGPRALERAIAYREQTNTEMPIVFAAVPHAAIDVASLPRNVTGQTLDTSFTKTLVAAKAIVPDLKRIALVGDPLERQAFRYHYVKEIRAIASQVDITDLTGLSMRELKERVSSLSSDVAIVYTTINIDGDGRAFLPSDALEEVAQVANRPIVTDIEQQLSRGGTGGFVVLNSVVGTEAGRMTARLLNGEPIANIPVTTADAVKPIFNAQQLQRWNVDEGRLPPGSQIRFRKTRVWEEYPGQSLAVAIVFLLQAALIAGLIFEARRRRAAETEKEALLGEVMHLSRFTTGGELTASIAHELRQPLAAIVSSAGAGLNWLKAQVPDVAEVRSALLDIVQDSHRANGVIDSVLALFRKTSQPHSPVHLNKALDQVLVLCARRMQNESITLEKRLIDSPEPIVIGDPIQLQQLFLNLILNAVEAMTQTSHERVLSVVSGCDAKNCTVTIEDTGPGLDPELEGDIFKPFVTNKAGGIGLGLAICKSIVQAHGGDIRASRDDGPGMRFLVTLPKA